MRERKEMIQYGQRMLRTKDDGIIGRKTIALIERQIEPIPQIIRHWKPERKLIALVQFKALSRGIEVGKIDGLIGSQTRYAFEQLLFLEKHSRLPETWRDEDEDREKNLATNRKLNPHEFPTYSNIRSYYGEPASGLKTVKVPYPLRLAWDTSVIVSKITCHKKVADSLLGILEDLLENYCLDGIQELGIDLYGGCFNKRKMRGGRKLSTHSWGVAIDLDPARNRLRWNSSKAEFAKPAYQFMLDAFAAEGWVSLGEAKDYDWMHFQAVRI